MEKNKMKRGIGFLLLFLLMVGMTPTLKAIDYRWDGTNWSGGTLAGTETDLTGVTIGNGDKLIIEEDTP